MSVAADYLDLVSPTSCACCTPLRYLRPVYWLTEWQRHHYARKVTGPVQDRIDILRHVLPPTKEEPTRLPGERLQTSLEVRERVAAARERQHRRYAGREWRLNGQVPSAVPYSSSAATTARSAGVL